MDPFFIDQNVSFNRRISEMAWRIRALAESSSSLREAAGRQVRTIRDSFRNTDGSANLALLRIFVSLPFSKLPENYRREIASQEGSASPEDRYLCLMGSAGDEADWNDPLKSRNHKYLRLPERESELTSMPMVRKVFAKLGIPYNTIIHPESSVEHNVEGYVLADDPMASPDIPDKKFIEDYKVASQISIGGILPSGSVFSLLLFCRIAMSLSMAENLSVFGPVFQMAYKNFDDRQAYW